MDAEKIPMQDDVVVEVNVTSKREKRVSTYNGKTTPFSLCVFNLMNAILGSGILGLANAAANLGVVLFTIMLVSVAALAFNSIRLLLELCDYTGKSSYEAIGKRAFGTSGKFVTAISIFIHTMGAMCSFLFIVKYELPEVIRVLVGAGQCDMAWYLNGDMLVMVVTVLVIVPLSSARNIGFLGYTSGLAMACMIIFTGVVIGEHWYIPCPIRAHATDIVEATTAATLLNSSLPSLNSSSLLSTLSSNFTGGSHMCASKASAIHQELEDALEHQVCDLKLATWNSKSAYAIPTMVFAFQCHASVLPIYTELENPTKARMQKVAVVSIANVFGLYFLAAVFGYLTFYSATGQELLLMYSAYNIHTGIILASRIMVLTCVIFSTPLLHFPARKAINEMLFENKPFSWIRHLSIMVVLLSSINLLVVYVPTIQEVFGFAGATCAPMLVIILPSLFYIKVIPGSYSSPKKLTAITLVAIGVVFSIFSMTLIISRWIG